MNKELAKIANFEIFREDHDILTFMLTVAYEQGLSQGVGGYALDRYDKETKKRVPTDKLTKLIITLFNTLQITKLEQIKNKLVWVYSEDEKITGIEGVTFNTDKPDILVFKKNFR